MKKQEILRKIKLFLFDMDGTLYIGDRLFDFTPRLLDTIKRNGGRYMFLTNNSSKSVNDYIKKLGGMGIKADCDDFLTSSQAMAYLLRRDYPGKTLYVCGTRSLEEELEKEGFSLTCDTSRAECIVMGYDTELTYQKLYALDPRYTVYCHKSRLCLPDRVRQRARLRKHMRYDIQRDRQAS